MKNFLKNLTLLSPKNLIAFFIANRPKIVNIPTIKILTVKLTSNFKKFAMLLINSCN